MLVGREKGRARNTGDKSRRPVDPLARPVPKVSSYALDSESDWRSKHTLLGEVNGERRMR